MSYYSKLDSNTYHTCRNCHAGNNIEKENLTEGQPAGASLCKECSDLRSQGNCQPGTPIPAE